MENVTIELKKHLPAIHRLRAPLKKAIQLANRPSHVEELGLTREQAILHYLGVNEDVVKSSKDLGDINVLTLARMVREKNEEWDSAKERAYAISEFYDYYTVEVEYEQDEEENE